MAPPRSYKKEPKDINEKRPIERAKIRKQLQRRRQGINQPLTRMLHDRSIGRPLTIAQQNLLRAKRDIEPLHAQTRELQPRIQSSLFAVNTQEYKQLTTKYKKLSDEASRLQQVIDNPGSFFWEDDTWKNKKPPPPPGRGGGQALMSV